jgi:hypothetical protein
VNNLMRKLKVKGECESEGPPQSGHDRSSQQPPDNEVSLRSRAMSSAAATEQVWLKDIHDPFIILIRQTMPQLSKWSSCLAAQTVGCLLLGALSIPMATGGNLAALSLIGVSLCPLVNLWGPATVSSLCDNMRDRLNEIRADEKNMHRWVVLLLSAAARLLPDCTFAWPSLSLLRASERTLLAPQ